MKFLDKEKAAVVSAAEKISDNSEVLLVACAIALVISVVALVIAVKK